jgi:hypothetical protein
MTFVLFEARSRQVADIIIILKLNRIREYYLSSTRIPCVACCRVMKPLACFSKKLVELIVDHGHLRMPSCESHCESPMVETRDAISSATSNAIRILNRRK